MSQFAESREKIYRALRARDFDRYRRAIQSAEAITLQHNLPNKVAVEIEWAVVAAVADALEVKA